MRWAWLGSGLLHGTLVGAAFLAALTTMAAPEAGLQAPPPVPLLIESEREPAPAPSFEAVEAPVPPVLDVVAAFEPDRPEPEEETLKAEIRPEPAFDRPLATFEKLAPPPVPEVESETAPVELLNPPPAYPVPARRRGIEGQVLVEVRIRVDGSVADPRVLEWSGSPSFADAAIAALQTWRYTPASIGGRPVERPHIVRFTFRLR